MNVTEQILPVLRAADLNGTDAKTEWLLENLWAAASVGIVGGPPKSCKTWLALDMAVSIASGTLCLGRYKPQHKGRVLLYAAEDSQSTLRRRLHMLAKHRNISLDSLEIFVITADRLRLDLQSDQKRLTYTVKCFHPDLLLLDPLVRLHRINENDAGEVSVLLDYLRNLQRQFHLAITLVHHTRKNCSASQPGQTLRGSSDLHAWSDSSLYLRRKQDQIIMVAEHRAAPAPPPIGLQLADGEYPHLQVVEYEKQNSNNLTEDILHMLKNTREPLTRTILRAKLKTRNERVGKALAALKKQNLIHRTPDGWCITAP
jgi:hypothetical protein